jgi:hypothetical protein
MDLSGDNHPLVNSAVHFLRCLTETYGAEAGMKLWENFNQGLDPEIKGQVFFAMITGTYEGRIVITGATGMTHNKVPAIKAVRAATGLGLKEAKDLIDNLYDDVRRGISGRMVIEVPSAKRHEHIQSLREAGLLC